MKSGPKKLFLAVALILITAIPGYFAVRGTAKRIGQRVMEEATDERQTGLKEGIPRSSAGDCPVDLPTSATDIYYAYDLYWQGGCMVCRYTYPSGDLRKQGEKHLRASPTWNRIGVVSAASVPEHRFSSLAWFQPAKIATGWESDSSGMLWQPKVWLDEVNRHIYVLDQN